MKPSPEQYSHIHEAYLLSLPPLKVARALRLTPITVIKEYLRLDEAGDKAYDPFFNYN